MTDLESEYLSVITVRVLTCYSLALIGQPYLFLASMLDMVAGNDPFGLGGGVLCLFRPYRIRNISAPLKLPVRPFAKIELPTARNSKELRRVRLVRLASSRSVKVLGFVWEKNQRSLNYYIGGMLF